MSHNILITGASGYLGGSLLARWKDANLPPYGKLYALVRSEEQAQAVKQYAAEPFLCDLNDHDKLHQSIISNEISIIFFLVDATSDKHQPTMIRALHEVKTKTGKDVHFLHTGGAKHFSSHGGLPTEKPLLDTDPDVYNILKNSVSPHPYFAQV
jgi:NAD dependent epimerase/dehydratase family